VIPWGQTSSNKKSTAYYPCAFWGKNGSKSAWVLRNGRVNFEVQQLESMVFLHVNKDLTSIFRVKGGKAAPLAALALEAKNKASKFLDARTARFSKLVALQC
jgi:hypothetical protein